jgi:RNA polymerase sigma factor (sigma-70 family)
MPANRVSEVIQYLRRVLPSQDAADVTDGLLLGRFIEEKDEAAIQGLIRRHGPMVWGVCCRLLRDHHDAEDAFQATFLVLVRKAASIVPQGMVANWLYGVAPQTALKARANAARRKGRERQVTEMPEPAAAKQDLWNDLQPLLDQELSRLPERYRALIVLCDLEGKTRKEAARQLGLPEGTVGSRLARARTLLARRLARHGLMATGGTLAAVLSEKAASAVVPASVVSDTMRTATLWACGQGAAAGAVSARVALLTDGVLKTMSLTKLKVVTVLLVAVAVTGFSTSLLGRQFLAARADSPVIAKVAETPSAATNASGRGPSNQEETLPVALASQEVRRLEGVWTVRHVETNGKALFDADSLKEAARITFEENTAKMTGLEVFSVRDFTFKLYPDRKPKAIDVTFQDGPKKGETFEGIYVIRGNEVHICLRLKQNELGRPKGYVTNSGTTLYTFILERAGAKEPAPGQAVTRAAPAAVVRLDAGLRDSGRKGIERITVEELAKRLREEGFQWKIVGRQITFTATVLTPGATPRVRIEGMDKGHFDRATLHNVGADNRLKPGDRVRVTGLIVDQVYGGWKIWAYSLTVLND